MNYSLHSPLIFVDCHARTVEIEANCITGTTQSTGMCVAVQNCVSIMNLLKNRENIKNPGIAEFLRKSQCGMKANSHQVCCELIDIDFGTVNELEGPVTTYFYGESI